MDPSLDGWQGRTQEQDEQHRVRINRDRESVVRFRTNSRRRMTGLATSEAAQRVVRCNREPMLRQRKFEIEWPQSPHFLGVHQVKAKPSSPKRTRILY